MGTFYALYTFSTSLVVFFIKVNTSVVFRSQNLHIQQPIVDF